MAELKKQMPNSVVDAVANWKPDNGRVDVMNLTYKHLSMFQTDPTKALDPSRYQLVILDEAHHSLGTMANRYLMDNFGHAMILGFTATEDWNSTRKLDTFLPDLVHKITDYEAYELGMIAPYRTAVFDAFEDMSEVRVNKSDYNQGDLEHTINVDVRNQRIIDMFATHFAGERAIFNVNTIEHAENLAELLRESGITALAVSGGMSKGAFRQAIGQFKNREIQALVQAKVIGEGYDDPSLAITVNVSPSFSKVRVKQRVRMTRIDPDNPGKVGLVIECIDRNYQKSPLLFGDEEVAGWYGISGLAQLSDIVEFYSSVPMPAPENPVIDEFGNLILKKKPKSAEAMRSQSQDAANALRRRRQQRLGQEIEESSEDDKDWGNYNEIDGNIDELVEHNAVASWIVFDTEIPEENFSFNILSAAISGLAENKLLRQADVQDRFKRARQLYAKFSQPKQEVVEVSNAAQSGRGISLLSGFFEFPEWQKDAECLGADAEGDRKFFIERGESTKEAKAICALCEVRIDCLEYALENSIKEGIWGGLSERQRRRIRKQRNLAVAAEAY